MDYERIIVELLGRIQVLEEKVNILMGENNKEMKNKNLSTNEIKNYIEELKMIAKKAGEKNIILRSGDIHRDLNLKSAMPTVCNAMYSSMREGDVILHTTPSGFSSTIEIEYKL